MKPWTRLFTIPQDHLFRRSFFCFCLNLSIAWTFQKLLLISIHLDNSNPELLHLSAWVPPLSCQSRLKFCIRVFNWLNKFFRNRIIFESSKELLKFSFVPLSCLFLSVAKDSISSIRCSIENPKCVQECSIRKSYFDFWLTFLTVWRHQITKLSPLICFVSKLKPNKLPKNKFFYFHQFLKRDFPLARKFSIEHFLFFRPRH